MQSSLILSLSLVATSSIWNPHNSRRTYDSTEKDRAPRSSSVTEKNDEHKEFLLLIEPFLDIWGTKDGDTCGADQYMSDVGVYCTTYTWIGPTRYYLRKSLLFWNPVKQCMDGAFAAHLARPHC